MKTAKCKMTVDMLRSGNTGYKHHHTSLKLGYISRKIKGEIKPYKGRFGEGYIIDSPRWDTTQYCDREYYIRETEYVFFSEVNHGDIFNRNYDTLDEALAYAKADLAHLTKAERERTVNWVEELPVGWEDDENGKPDCINVWEVNCNEEN